MRIPNASKSLLLTALFLMWFVWVPAISVGQNVVYVNHAATGSNTGTSWPDAFINLQDALASMSSGDEAWVAKGTYSPDQGASVTLGDRMASFQLYSGFKIYGGFAGDETTQDQRDPERNETVLSGDLMQNDPDVFQINDVSRTDNSDNVILVHDIEGGEPVELNGFTVEGGNSTQRRIGGGLFILTGGFVNISHTKWISNYSTRCGGAVGSHGSFNISDSFFERNQTDIDGNLCRGGSGAALFQLREFLNPPELPVPRVTNVRFVNNKTGGCGAALAIGLGGIEIVNSVFVQNESGHGGALCTQGSNEEFPVVIANSLFTGNLALRFGAGALYSENALIEMSNVVFSGNSVTPDAPFSWGGALYLEHSTINIYNSTFFGNSAKLGTEIYTERSTVAFDNSIIWNNESGDSNWIYSSVPSTFLVRYSILPSEQAVPYLVTEAVLVTDPLFQNPVGLDQILGTEDDNLELGAESPARGSGNASYLPQDQLDLDGDLDTMELLPVDFKGYIRISGTDGLDMGAYEYNSTSLSYDIGFPPNRTSACDQLELYPNPTRGFLNMQLDSGHPPLSGTYFTMVDILGRVVLSGILTGNVSHIQMDVSELTPGVYFVVTENTNLGYFCSTMGTVY